MKKVELIFQRHRSARDIVFCFYRSRLKIKNEFDLLNSEVDLRDINSDVKKGTVRDALKIIRKKEIWGFCSIHKDNIRIIHYWFKLTVHIADIAEVLFHESVHAIGIRKESTAIKYGILSSLITQVLLQRFRNKIKKFWKGKQ